MGRKRVPHYWWDFEWIDNEMKNVIVESDDERFPLLKTIPIGMNAGAAIDEASKLIDDLNAGRVDPRRIS